MSDHDATQASTKRRKSHQANNQNGTQATALQHLLVDN